MSIHKSSSEQPAQSFKSQTSEGTDYFELYFETDELILEIFKHVPIFDRVKNQLLLGPFSQMN